MKRQRVPAHGEDLLIFLLRPTHFLRRTAVQSNASILPRRSVPMHLVVVGTIPDDMGSTGVRAADTTPDRRPDMRRGRRASAQLTAREAAQALGVNERTVRRAIARG